MSCLLVVQDEGCAVLCSVTNKTQDMNQIAGTHVDISLLPIYTSILLSSRVRHTASNKTHRQHPELPPHHVTCTKQCL